MTLERKPDELWTEYLVRRLDAEFKLGIGSFNDTSSWKIYTGDASKLEGYLLFSHFSAETKEEIRNNPLIQADTAIIAGKIPSCISRELVIQTSREQITLERYLNIEELIPRLDHKNYTEQTLDHHLIYETVSIDLGCEYVTFYFDSGTTAEVQGGIDTGLLSRYEEGKNYDAEEIMDTIVTIAKEASGARVVRETGLPEPNFVPLVQRQRREEFTKLEEILQTVRRLDRIAAEHPVVMKEEGRYLQELYVKAINEDVNNLQFFEYRDKRIPYVLVHSSDLEGHVGKPFHNLYFVARDRAPEDWQQKIVAFHESQCLHFGHEAAKGQEPRLARFLGKEQEYLVWREQIDNGKLGCQGREED